MEPPKELVDHFGLEGAEEFISEFEANVEEFKRLDKEASNAFNEVNRIIEETNENLRLIREKYSKKKNVTVSRSYITMAISVVGVVVLWTIFKK